MYILNTLVGTALLFFGRKAYWLFAAGAGFMTGLSLTGRLFRNAPEWLTIIVAIGIGLLGAVLAVFFQRVAIGLAGFLAGGYLLLNLASAFGLEQGLLPWLAFALGGILGLILVGLLFDWTLIGLSSLAGATMILEGFHLQRGIAFLVFLILLILGISVQAGIMRAERRRRKG